MERNYFEDILEYGWGCTMSIADRLIEFNKARVRRAFCIYLIICVNK